MRFARSLAAAPVPEGTVARAVAAAAWTRAVAPLALTLAAIATAVVAQARFGAIADVSWMITICEKWLDGAIPYVDFVETNPRRRSSSTCRRPRSPARSASTPNS